MRTKSLLIGLVALAAIAIVFAVGSYAQLQQSGGPGSTVTVGSSLPAGSAIIGKFGIDQTTPGTTNGVQVNAALPAGSNIVGKFGIDQTTPGTTNLVAVSGITNALPAGTNVLGIVKTVVSTVCGTTPYDSGPVLLPTAATSVTSTATCVSGVYLTNTDTAAHTVTVTDGSTACSAGVCTYVGPAFSLPALSNMMIPLDGMKLTGGVKWNVTDASSNKVIGQVFGWQ